MSEHTPGPWNTGRAFRYFSGEKYPLITPENGENPIAEVSVDYVEAVTEANARLIAAAPELLELAKALDNWSRNGNPMELLQEVGSILEQARAAIAKAEGR